MPEKLYSIKESAMTNMADTIRQLTGTTGPITGEEIGNYVVTNLPNSENLDEVLEDQDDIIAQIQTALQGKASGGGGGSIETCTVTISSEGPSSPEIPTIYYTDASTLTVESITTQETTLTVPTNTIVAITGWTSMSESSGSCNQLYYGYQYSAYQITGNCMLIYRE